MQNYTDHCSELVRCCKTCAAELNLHELRRGETCRETEVNADSERLVKGIGLFRVIEFEG